MGIIILYYYNKGNVLYNIYTGVIFRSLFCHVIIRIRIHIMASIKSREYNIGMHALRPIIIIVPIHIVTIRLSVNIILYIQISVAQRGIFHEKDPTK